MNKAMVLQRLEQLEAATADLRNALGFERPEPREGRMLLEHAGTEAETYFAQPQLLPSIDTAVFLAEHGVKGATLARVIPKFSRAVELAYIDAHVAMPPKVSVHVDGVGPRLRNVYQGQGDLDLMEMVFASKFTPELDWIES